MNVTLIIFLIWSYNCLAQDGLKLPKRMKNIYEIKKICASKNDDYFENLKVRKLLPRYMEINCELNQKMIKLDRPLKELKDLTSGLNRRRVTSSLESDTLTLEKKHKLLLDEISIRYIWDLPILIEQKKITYAVHIKCKDLIENDWKGTTEICEQFLNDEERVTKKEVKKHSRKRYAGKIFVKDLQGNPSQQ